MGQQRPMGRGSDTGSAVEVLVINDLEALAELEKSATPGPWEVPVDDDTRVCFMRDGVNCEWCIALAGETYDGERWTDETRARWRKDALHIAAARNALPALIAEARRAQSLETTYQQRLADAMQEVRDACDLAAKQKDDRIAKLEAAMRNAIACLDNGIGGGDVALWLLRTLEGS